MRRKTAFTLIELLIVVAIIAILAAIAVPNFLEAQVRAKVSRCKADMRSIVTAIEAYRVDNNNYPPYGSFEIVGALGEIVMLPATEPQVLEPSWITTPVAYLSSNAGMQDPFTKFATTIIDSQYNYVNWDDERYADYEPVHEAYGEWRLTGSGPDNYRFNLDLDGTQFLIVSYNPTNGTISVGDIIRTQKDPEGVFAP